MSKQSEPRLAFRHLEQEDWIEVKAQMHGDTRVSIWEKYLEWTPSFLSIYAKYDPVLARRGKAVRRFYGVIREQTLAEELSKYAPPTAPPDTGGSGLLAKVAGIFRRN